MSDFGSRISDGAFKIWWLLTCGASKKAKDGAILKRNFRQLLLSLSATAICDSGILFKAWLFNQQH
jgi:hypothetical protein